MTHSPARSLGESGSVSARTTTTTTTTVRRSTSGNRSCSPTPQPQHQQQANNNNNNNRQISDVETTATRKVVLTSASPTLMPTSPVHQSNSSSGNSACDPPAKRRSRSPTPKANDPRPSSPSVKFALSAADLAKSRSHHGDEDKQVSPRNRDNNQVHNKK